MTLTELADSIGVSTAFLSLVERDLSTPTPIRVQQLSTVLNADPDHLTLLAHRIPEDIQAILEQNPHLLQILRDSPSRSQ